jgi:hypothetical protein
MVKGQQYYDPIGRLWWDIEKNIYVVYFKQNVMDSFGILVAKLHYI